MFLSANLMKNSIENKPFIDAVYNMIRYGEAQRPGNRDMKIYADWIFSQFHMNEILKGVAEENKNTIGANDTLSKLINLNQKFIER